LWGAKSITSVARRDVLQIIEAVRDHGTDKALAAHGIKPKRHRGFKKHRLNGKGRPTPIQARNLLGYLKTFFGWAIERGVYGLEASPCDHLRAVRIIGERNSVHRILSDDELFAFWRATKRLPYPYGPAYQLLAYSALRLNECVGAAWLEFDLRGKQWIIPAERMKGKNSKARPHCVPLTPAILTLLEKLPRFDNGEFLFSTTLGAKPVCIGSGVKERLDARMLRTLRALARLRGHDPQNVMLDRWVNHDLRRTARSRMTKLRINSEVAEACLAHVQPGIKGVYNLYDYFDEKRVALELWDAHLRAIVEPAAVPLRA
jgi:integrase